MHQNGQIDRSCLANATAVCNSMRMKSCRRIGCACSVVDVQLLFCSFSLRLEGPKKIHSSIRYGCSTRRRLHRGTLLTRDDNQRSRDRIGQLVCTCQRLALHRATRTPGPTRPPAAPFLGTQRACFRALLQVQQWKLLTLKVMSHIEALISNSCARC